MKLGNLTILGDYGEPGPGHTLAMLLSVSAAVESIAVNSDLKIYNI